MNEPLIPIFLTDLEAKSFVEFQKHRAIIGLLESIDAFSIRGGSVTIHFDNNGKISSLQKLQEYRN